VTRISELKFFYLLPLLSDSRDKCLFRIGPFWESFYSRGKAPVSFLSIRLSARTSIAATVQISVKFDIGDLNENLLENSKFG